MKIAFVGSRDFNDKNLVIKSVCEMAHNYQTETDPFILVSGGARGVDNWAEMCARSLGVKCRIFPADWDQYGKSAVYKRNKDIVKNADLILAFWDGKSKGTKHSIDLAIAEGKPVNIYIRN